MKLLLYSLYAPTAIDGVSNASRQFVSALEGRGINVIVVTTSFGWPQDETKRQHSGKVRIFNAWLSSHIDFAPGLFVSIGKNIRNFDIIQLHGTFSLPTVWAAYAAKVAKIPYIICPQGNSIPSTMVGINLLIILCLNVSFSWS